jgi:hypothetical protein
MATQLTRGRRGVDALLLGALYLLELSALILALDIPRLIGRPLQAVVTSYTGLYAILATLGVGILIVVIARRYARDRREGTRRFALTLALNMLSVALVVGVGEVATRLLTVRAPEGDLFMGTLLLPRDWEFEVTRNRELVGRAKKADPYLVPDEVLGWTVGTARRSDDGLNQSSIEGIRSGRAGISFADTHPAWRVALVGDSFTFCLDVGYEDSWGYRLELLLGPETQVLNFGVAGYGVDQAYLRYTRDARPWNARVVVLGVFPGDLERSMGLYPFISFPGSELPYAKPRFALKDGALSLLNVPLPSADSVLSTRSIAALPFIDYDVGYRESDWRWRALHASRLVRVALSRYPVRTPPSPVVSPEALRAVNGELILDFVRLARADRSIPIVLYMPGRNDFLPWAQDPTRLPMITREVLRRYGIEFTDLTPCVATVPEEERFVPEKRHYSPRTNAAIAGCLRELVSSHL